MAEQNKSPLTPEQAQQLSDSGMLSPDTASLFPSTPENQVETESAQEDQAAGQAAMAQAKSSLLNQTRHGIATQEIAPVEAALEAKRLQEGREADAAIDTKIAQNDLQDEKAIIEEKIRRANEAQAFLTEMGTPSSEIDAQLQELEAELQGTTIAKDTIDDKSPADVPGDDMQDPEKNLSRIKAEDTMELEDKTQQVKSTIMDRMAQLQGEVEAVESQRAELIEEQNKIFEDAQDLKRQAKESQVDPIWGGDNVGTKIMAALAIGLGAYRAELTGGQNQGLQMVNQIIDRSVQQNQQSFKNQLALKSAMLDKTQQQLRVLDSQTASKSKKAQILSIQQQLEQQKQAVEQQLLQQAQKSRINQKLRTGELTAQEEQAVYDTLGKEQIEQANVLRKDYERAIRDNQIESLIPTVQDLQEFTESPSAAGDIAMIFAYMKSLDPKSVVREGEFQLAAEAGSAAQRAAGVANKILTGERVPDSVRKDFFNRAKGMIKNKMKSAQKVSDRFKSLAVSQGIPPKAGLGVKTYSFADIMPNEAAMDMLKEKLKLPEDQIQKMLDKRGVKAADLLIK